MSPGGKRERREGCEIIRQDWIMWKAEKELKPLEVCGMIKEKPAKGKGKHLLTQGKIKTVFEKADAISTPWA